MAETSAESVFEGRVLLPHHGTAGAEQSANWIWRAAVPGRTTLVHLYVVPEFWAGMQGDDWLNNAWTRDAFAQHLEGHLAEEAKAAMRAVSSACAARGIACESLLRVGEPTACILAAAKEAAVDAVVIGPPREKGVPGYRSRVDLEKLVRGLAVPLIVAREK